MKDTYGPPSGKRMVLMIDDLNMPAKDLFGESGWIRVDLTISTGGLGGKDDMHSCELTSSGAATQKWRASAP